MKNSTLMDILSRGSTRKYQDKEVHEELVTRLLQAAMSAPSACNQQCWHFVIIRNQEIKKELSQIHGGYQSINTAPVSIIVCGEPKAAIMECYWEHDCAAATENILIAAQSFGLRSLWQGVNSTVQEHIDKICGCLNLPDNIKPFSIISIGYSDETINVKEKFNKDKIHYDKVW